MAMPTVSVSLELNNLEAGEFIVGTSLVGGADLIGDGLSDLKSYATRCSIRRGRWGALYEDFEAANISVTLNNETRLFDPTYVPGIHYGDLVPSRAIEVQVGGVTLVTGFVEDYDLEYDVSGRSVAVIKATDALGRLSAIQFDAWTSTSLNAAGKISAVLDRPEVAWSSVLRDLLGATVLLSGITVPVPLQSDAVTWGSNCLGYLRLIARSDWLSWLFASATGSVTLRPVFKWATTSNTWNPGAAVATFGGAGIAFQGIRAQYGSETMFSEVSVDFLGGTAQTATVANLPAWQVTYGPPRRLSPPETLIGAHSGNASGDFPLTAAAVALKLAQDLLAYYDTPTYRITEITVELAALGTTDQTTVLSIDISEPITISFTPNNLGSAITQTLIVQGIAHEITPDSHVVTFSVIDYLI